MRTIFAALFLGALMAAMPCSAQEAEPAGGAESAKPSLAPILRKITPAVVKIEIRGRVPVVAKTGRKKGETREIHEVGSGVVYDADQGLILTNNHVIEHADDITVALTDGRLLKGTRIGTDPDFDLAIIKVPPDHLTTIPYGDSSQVQVGDVVLAIGYPMNMGQSVTSGIVGGLHRTNIGLEQHENFIQTDAAIYPGNSGGALVNISGELIGINTAFIGSTNTNPGVGFAIPSNMARTIATQLLTYGDIHRGTLGLTIEDPTPTMVRNLGLPRPSAVITKVDPGSAGDRAGLRPGDVVVRIGNEPVRNAPFLRTRIALLRIGEAAELAVWRDGKPVAVRAVMAPR